MDSNEEKQNKRHEENSLREAKGVAEKKSKDKALKTVKKVFMAMKAALTVVITLAKMFVIILIVLCITAIITWFSNLISGSDESNNTDPDEEYNSTISTEQGGMDITDEGKQVTDTQIISYIDNYKNSNNTLKQEMKNNIGAIMEWQETYGYSSLFLVTVAFEDNILAENFISFLESMYAKALEWKNSGYKTVKEIAKNYVEDDTAQEWANNIENKIQENSINTGIITYGEKAMSGDGYNTVFVAKDGKMYRNYKQNDSSSSYSNKIWARKSYYKKLWMSSNLCNNSCKWLSK